MCVFPDSLEFDLQTPTNGYGCPGPVQIGILCFKVVSVYLLNEGKEIDSLTKHKKGKISNEKLQSWNRIKLFM